MRDLKQKKKKRSKGNRLLREKTPKDWRKIFHRILRVSVVGFSGALVVTAGALAGQLLLDSGYFRIETLRVVNNSRVAREEIIAQSDIQTGASIFSLDLPMIGGKIEENPWIASASVTRIFPREVVIEVRERNPRAIVNLGYLYYIDDDGEVFKPLSLSDSLDYPVITGIGRDEMLSQGDGVRHRLRKAVGLIKTLEKRRYFNLEDVSELHSDESAGVTLFTYRGGIPVYMGQDHFADKLDRLEKIYKEIEPSLRALKYIDLNVSDRVIVKVNAQS